VTAICENCKKKPTECVRRVGRHNKKRTVRLCGMCWAEAERLEQMSKRYAGRNNRHTGCIPGADDLN